MKSDKIQSAIGKIDVDLIEAANQKQSAGKRRQIWRSVGLAAACLVLIVTAVSVHKLLDRSGDTPDPPASTTEGLSKDGGTDGKINLQAEIKRTGEDCILTVEEANAFMNERLPEYREDLRASGLVIDDLRFAPNGCSHVRTGDSGNELILNARDFLLYDGDELVAMVTVIKEPDRISGGLAWGGPWFSEYQAFLEAHRGEALVYLYVGDVEAILTPDGQIVTLLEINHPGSGLESVIDPAEQARYYEFFRFEENTYTP